MFHGSQKEDVGQIQKMDLSGESTKTSEREELQIVRVRRVFSVGEKNPQGVSED